MIKGLIEGLQNYHEGEAEVARKKVIMPSSPANPPPIKIGEVYEMKITSVNSASKFGVQLRNRAAMIKHIQSACQEFGKEGPKLGNLEIGKLCLARFDADNNWYRAFIREIDEASGYAIVYFTDYGNMDECKIEGDLKECPPSIQKILPQVIECRWVGAAAGEGMEKIIEKLDSLLDAETYIKAQVLDFGENAGWLFNEGDENGPVVVAVPELELIKKVDPKVLQEYTDKILSRSLEGKHLTNGHDVVDANLELEIEHLLENADYPDEFITASPGQNMLLKALDELKQEIQNIRLQIVNMGTDNQEPMVRVMTEEESAARVQELKVEGAQCDKRINVLLQLISEKDTAIKNALHDFDTDVDKMQKLIREKDEELVKLRNQAKLGCL